MTPEETVADLRRIGALSLLRRICALHRVREADLLHVRGRKTASLCRARHHLWAVIRHSTQLSFHEIADVFGVDHTSIEYGVRRWERELAAMHAGAGT